MQKIIQDFRDFKMIQGKNLHFLFVKFSQKVLFSLGVVLFEGDCFFVVVILYLTKQKTFNLLLK